MLPLARVYAVGQQIDVAVADQEIVLHYVLALLNAEGLIGPQPGAAANGPLLFKGGTALRKCVFGSTGRFSQDADLDATHHNGFEAEIEAAFAAHDPYHAIRFAVPPSVTPRRRTSRAPSATSIPTALGPSSSRSPTGLTRSSRRAHSRLCRRDTSLESNAASPSSSASTLTR